MSCCGSSVHTATSVVYSCDSLSETVLRSEVIPPAEMEQNPSSDLDEEQLSETVSEPVAASDDSNEIEEKEIVAYVRGCPDSKVSIPHRVSLNLQYVDHEGLYLLSESFDDPRREADHLFC